MFSLTIVCLVLRLVRSFFVRGPKEEWARSEGGRGRGRKTTGVRPGGVGAVRGKGCGRKGERRNRRRESGQGERRGRKEERAWSEGREGAVGRRERARSGEKGATGRRGCGRRATHPAGPGCSTGRRRPGYPRRARPGSSSGCPVRSARRGNAASPRCRARSRASRECGGNGSG